MNKCSLSTLVSLKSAYRMGQAKNWYNSVLIDTEQFKCMQCVWGSLPIFLVQVTHPYKYTSHPLITQFQFRF